MVNLFQLVNQLREIADQGDKLRLSVWVTQFEAEFPDLADEIKYCAQMGSPKTVLAYLRERDQRFALLALIPNIEPVIQFLMDFIRERSNDDSDNNFAVVGGVAFSGRNQSRRRAIKPHS